jgi:hypothetical protein
MCFQNKLICPLLIFFCFAGGFILPAGQSYIPFIPPSGSAALAATEKLPAINELYLLKSAYPDVRFTMEYDPSEGDWCLSVTSYGKTTKLYRAGGRYLTASQLPSKEDFQLVLYPYERILEDPACFSSAEIAHIKSYSSGSSRADSAVASTALFSAIYDAATRTETESHLRTIIFLGKRTTVNERIIQPLMRVQEKIKKLALTDPDVSEFCSTLLSTDSYAWRSVRDTDSRSFHSYGIAIDILPKEWAGKILYWKYERDKNGDTWMLTPLSDRWMPPEPVIKAFEDEGFIWGGRWVIWDNMHFEYHPELIKAGYSSSSVGVY